MEERFIENAVAVYPYLLVIGHLEPSGLQQNNTCRVSNIKGACMMSWG